jgi:putative transposase
MSIHGQAAVWLHIIWGTLYRRPILLPPVDRLLSDHLAANALENGITMRVNRVLPDHVHALVQLPTGLSLEQVVKLLKGESSYWINQEELIPGGFSWGRGYAAFSVSFPLLGQTGADIARETESGMGRSLLREYADLFHRHGIAWKEDEYF